MEEGGEEGGHKWGGGGGREQDKGEQLESHVLSVIAGDGVWV